MSIKAKAQRALDAHFGPLDAVASGEVDGATILERVLAIGVIAFLAAFGPEI